MKHRVLLLLSAITVSVFSTPAQEAQGPRKVAARVISQGAGGSVVIDRGERDLVAKGDRVLFLTRGGARLSGTVVMIDDRSATVELRDRGLVVEPGTRAEIVIPAARVPEGPQTPPVAPPVAPPQQPVERETPTEPRRWRNLDPDYRAGQPLLTGARAVRPEERLPKFSGRAYAMGNLTHTPGDTFKNSFIRVGTELQYDNPFGLGGGINFQGEANYKNETSGNSDADLLLERLSYRWGGTRFEDTRVEVGRFLTWGIPEFGLLDGVEVTERLKNGSRVGGTVGWLPTLNDDLDTGADFQLAAYFLWYSDETERFMIGGGYQKSWHHSHTDRDLVVVKSHYLPEGEGWDFYGMAKIDFYYGTDDFKNHSVEVTQALVTTSRRWDNGDGLEVSYRHLMFPEMLRREFWRPLPNDIRDDHLDRVGVEAWTQWTEDKRLHGFLNGFIDHDDSGGAFEAGVDINDFLVDNSRTDITGFGEVAQFQKVAGGRWLMEVMLEDGRWDFFYEFSYVNFDKQPADSNDMLQHRIRASRHFYTETGWDLSVHAEVDFWDDEVSWYGGAMVQRTF